MHISQSVYGAIGHGATGHKIELEMRQRSAPTTRLAVIANGRWQVTKPEMTTGQHEVRDVKESSLMAA